MTQNQKLAVVAGVVVVAAGIWWITRLVAPREAEPRGRTITATSPQLADVQAAYNQAVDGDTVGIPSGTATWTGKLTVAKAITLRGAGKEGASATTIRDGVQSGKFLQINLVSSKISRLTGINFEHGGRTTYVGPPEGIFKVVGVPQPEDNTARFRWDNCTWNNLKGVVVFDNVIGVVDHVDFVRGNNISSGSLTYIYHSLWNENPNPNHKPLGDGSWASPVDFGSDKFLVFERCKATNPTPQTTLRSMTDSLFGARFIVRYCEIHNLKVSTHGTESGGRPRGNRVFIAYGNHWTGTNIEKEPASVRGGIGVFHDNTIEGFTASPRFGVTNFRATQGFPPWGPADGTCQWDNNDITTDNGWGPGIHFKGKAKVDSANRVVTVVKLDGSDPTGWETNKWKWYTVRRTTGTSTGQRFGWINASTANTITYNMAKDGEGVSLKFLAGDELEIRKINHTLDLSGRGEGGLVPPGNPPSGPPPWPAGQNDQISRPCYEWNNGAVDFVCTYGARCEVDAFSNATPPPSFGYAQLPDPHWLIAFTEGGASPTPTPTPSPTPTQTPTIAPSPTPPQSPTPSPTPTLSPSPCPTATPTGTATPTPTPTATPTAIPSPSPTVPVALAAPSNLAAVVVKGKDVQLSWTDNSGDETGFAIERSAPANEGNICLNYSAAAKLGPNITTWTDTTTDKKSFYCYKIRALRGQESSDWSPVVEIAP
jgi:hypothetical protein